MKFFSIFLILLFFSTAWAKEKTPPFEEPVIVNADSLIYDRDLSLIKAQGKVEMVQGERSLKADRVSFNLTTQDLLAEGGVILKEGEDFLESDKIEMNLKSQKGVISQGKIFFKKGHFYLTGEKIEREGEKKYSISKATCTTCDGENPPWRFRGKEIKVRIEGYSTIKGAVFDIKNQPIFYLPYFIYPTKLERQSGFLMPKMGYSSSEGVKMDNAYFWAIAENRDATFYLDYHSRKGIGEGLEYRYILTEDSEGRFYGYYIQERDSYQEKKYTEILDRAQERWNLGYEGTHYFSPTFFAKAYIDLPSDRQFYKDYGENFDQGSKEKVESTLFFTKLWPNFMLVPKLSYTEDLCQENDYTLQRFPEINLLGLPLRIPSTPFWFGLNLSYNYLFSEEGSTGSRIDLLPNISLPFTYQYLKFLPEFGLRETLYFGTSVKGDQNREVPYFKTTISTTLLKYFDGGWLKGMSHTIEPQISYTYIPPTQQGGFPLFDDLDRISKKNALTYSLISRLLGSENAKEFLYLRLAQVYNFSDFKKDYLTKTSEDYLPSSRMIGEVRFLPSEGLWLGFDTNYYLFDTKLHSIKYFPKLSLRAQRSNLKPRLPRHFVPRNDLIVTWHEREFKRKYGAYLNLEDKKGDSLSLEYRYINDIAEEINLLARFRPKRSWELSYENRYSLSEGLSLESIYGLSYYHQCWGLEAKLRERPEQEGRERETRFLITFSLRGLGEVKK